MRPLIGMSKATSIAACKFIKFLLVLTVTLNFIACIWLNLGREPNGWVGKNNYLVSVNTDFEEYVASLYWACTVFATIGYGELVGTNDKDLIFTMFVFVIFFRRIDVWIMLVFIFSRKCK